LASIELFWQEVFHLLLVVSVPDGTFEPVNCCMVAFCFSPGVQPGGHI